MGSQRTMEVTEPRGLTREDTVTMGPEEALAALRRFAFDNGFTKAEFGDAFDLLRQSAAQPGVTMTVPTAYSTTAMDHASRVHDTMDAITGSTVAVELALRATGAQPGTHFAHGMRGDACQLTNVCTNEVG